MIDLRYFSKAEAQGYTRLLLTKQELHSTNAFDRETTVSNLLPIWLTKACDFHVIIWLSYFGGLRKCDWNPLECAATRA